MAEAKIIRFTFANGESTIDINGVKGPACTNVLANLAEKLKITCDKVVATEEMTALPVPCPEAIKG